ncbi:hypothetical protein CRD60_04080 [Bifidobacterium aemilianum]|uniref:Gram-positive cocci surface proteins LPxTG domain-containing protein n=1 Tax=Bifidobacterium aemilianum TaxID=2493120 RepID=A0A366K965_9BIFI|nr:hypothetical protein [Bifidobacterium aemilianum]RBP97782.1 hypothetical protein CRD60_04080 [Bifidobacterium aemilianum]
MRKYSIQGWLAGVTGLLVTGCMVFGMAGTASAVEDTSTSQTSQESAQAQPQIKVAAQDGGKADAAQSGKEDATLTPAGKDIAVPNNGKSESKDPTNDKVDTKLNAGQLSKSVAPDAPLGNAPHYTYDVPNISNPSVSEIGAHSVKITFDYSIIRGDGSWPIRDMVAMLKFQRVRSITPLKPIDKIVDYYLEDQGAIGYDKNLGISDNKLTQQDYSRNYGSNSNTLTDDKGNVLGTFEAQDFVRWEEDTWAQGSHPESGSMSLTLIGVDPNTLYSGAGYTVGGHDYSDSQYGVLWAKTQELGKTSMGQQTPVNMTRIVVGVNMKSDGGPLYQASLVPVPAFKTISEPQSVAEGELNTGNAGDMKPGDVQANGSSRFYINSLKEACKAKVDNNENCFWYSYIYSTPQKLTGPDGAPYTAIKKDEQGRYYFDAFIPSSLTGDHKVALLDDQGQVQAWTPVTLGETQGQTSPAAVASHGAASGRPAGGAGGSAPAGDPVADPGSGEMAHTGVNVAVVAGTALALMAAGASLGFVRRFTKV